MHGALALDNSTGIHLYGRVAGFADCRHINPPAELRPLCPDRPGSGLPAPAWIWHSSSPLYRVPGPTFGATKEHLAQRFAVRAVIAQPADYLHLVRVDVQRLFTWHRGPYPNAYTTAGWRFSTRPWPALDRQLEAGGTQRSVIDTYEQGDARTQVAEPFAGWLIRYQDLVFVRGPMLALSLLLGVAGLVPRSRTQPAVGRLPLLLVELTALSLVFVPILTVGLDYRYVMPGYPFAGLAAVLGMARLVAGWLPWRPSGRNQAHLADHPRRA